MNQKEFDSVISLKSFERYKYFIKKVADFEELWTIINVDGDYALSDVEDNVMITFWPKPKYITSNLTDGWENCKPKKLTLDDLENDIFDLIASHNFLINIFPVNGKSGFIVDLNEFARDLGEELKKY
jgi:hypothetical protein